MDAIQTSPVHSDLVVHLVRLLCDAVNVLVLGIDLLAHGSAKSIQSLCSTVKLVQVVVNFIFYSVLAYAAHFESIALELTHLVILTVSLKLILCPICECRFSARLRSAFHASFILVLPGRALPSGRASGISLSTFRLVRLHDLAVSLISPGA